MTLNKQNNNTGPIAHQSLSVQLALTGHSFLTTHTHTKEVLFFCETIFDQATTPEELLSHLTQKINDTPELLLQKSYLLTSHKKSTTPPSLKITLMMLF